MHLQKKNTTVLRSGGSTYEELNKINISTFVKETAPHYLIYRCYFGRYSCRNSWKQISTFHGQCITTNVTNYPKYDSDNSLEITLAVNFTDLVGGWSGTETGIVYSIDSIPYRFVPTALDFVPLLFTSFFVSFFFSNRNDRCGHRLTFFIISFRILRRMVDQFFCFCFNFYSVHIR